MDRPSQQELESMAITIFISSFLSLAASLAVLVTFCFFRQLQIFQMRIIAMLTAYDFLWSLTNIIIPIQYWVLKDKDYDVKNHTFICDAQSWLTIFSVVGSVWWTSFICHQLLITFYKYNRRTSSYYFRWYTIIGSLFPALFATIPITYNAYGSVRPFHKINCFISYDRPSTEFLLTSLLFFYLPIWVSFAYNMYAMLKTVKYIKQSGVNESVRSQTYYLFIFPTIIFIAWSIPTFKQIIFPFYNSPVWLDNIVFSLNIGQGFLNAIAYAGSAMKHIMNDKNETRSDSMDDILDLISESESDDDVSNISLSLSNSLMNQNIQFQSKH